jgi:hypothetical protein
MNRAEIRTTMRTFLNEESPGFWSNTNLDAYIDLANARVNSIISNTREDYFTRSATFTSVVGQKSYAFPSDCRFIRRIEIYDPTDAGYIVKLEEQKFPRTEANNDWMYGQSKQPKEYTMYGSQFNLLPIPDAAYPMRVYYDVRQSNLANDAATPDSPLEFHDSVVFLACLYAKKQNEDDDSWYGEMFRTRKEELLSYLMSRGSDDPKTVEGFLEGFA